MAKPEISINKIEPPHWWTQMNQAELMLLVYGTNIATLTPEIDSDNVIIHKVAITENPNYLFVYLNISPQAMPGIFQIDFKKNKKTILSHPYELKARIHGSALRVGFSSADVIYLLMPDRFSRGNSGKDNQTEMFEKVSRERKDARHGGDIQGIINKLDYLEDLGITAIWSTPLLEDNMNKVSYHGYAITDLYRIDPRFGSNGDYVRLSAEAKKRGIKTIMDMVPNHIGLNHWWMKDLPAKDWIHHHPEFTRSNHRKEVWHDPYVAETDQYYNEAGWFDPSMPDLNQSNPLLHTYLKQNAVWWVEFADLDGLRVDTYPYMDQWYAAEWTKAIRTEYPNLNIVGECWLHHPSQIAYWQSGVSNSNAYDSQLPSVMDFAWQESMMNAINEDEQHWSHGMGRLYQHFAMDYLYANPINLLIFLDNHDTHRFGEAIKGDVRKMKLALTHLLTTRGIPQIYYGTEILMLGDKAKGDDDIRREMPGGWPGDKRDAFKRTGRTKKENQVFNHLRQLLHYRKNNRVIHCGKMKHFVPENNVYVYFRYNDEKTIMVILNNGIHRKYISTARFSETLSVFTAGVNIFTGKAVSVSKSIFIQAKSALILELQ